MTYRQCLQFHNLFIVYTASKWSPLEMFTSDNALLRHPNSPSPEFPTSQNFYEGDVQVWRPYSRFPRGFGTRLTKSKVCCSGTRANSVYMEKFSLGWRLTFANLWLFVTFFPPAKFGGVAFLARQKRAIRASFLPENRIFHQFAKFSPSKVSAVRFCLVFMIQWLTGSAEKIDA